MASCALSIEHLSATITGTATTTTVDITLGQNSANCLLDVTFKSGSGSATLNTRLPEVWFSDSNTITIQRNTGTDIGTITYHIEVIELDPAQCDVTHGTFTMTGTASTTATVAIAGAITTAFAFHSYRTSFSNTSQPGRTLTRITVTNTTTLTFNRDGSTGNISGRYILVEALGGEFTVVHDTMAVGSGTETGSEAVTGDPNIAKSFLYASTDNGQTDDDWDTAGFRCELSEPGGVATFSYSRADGAAAGAFTANISYQVVTLTQDEVVERGRLTITATSVTASVGSPVALDSCSAHPTVHFGMGEGNGATGTELSNWHGHYEMVTNGDELTISVVSDITPNGVYAYEVINWAVSALTPVSQTLVANAEMLQGVSATKVANAEMLQGIAATKVANAEMLQGVSATKVANAEMLQGVSATKVANAEMLQGISATKVANAEMLQGIAATLVANAEMLSPPLTPVSQILVANAEMLQGIVATLIANAEMLSAAVLAPPVNWESPRSRGIVSVDKCAPHVRRWNPEITFTYTGSLVTRITQEAPDGTIAHIDLTWSGGFLVMVSRWVEA